MRRVPKGLSCQGCPHKRDMGIVRDERIVTVCLMFGVILRWGHKYPVKCDPCATWKGEGLNEPS